MVEALEAVKNLTYDELLDSQQGVIDEITGELKVRITLPSQKQNEATFINCFMVCKGIIKHTNTITKVAHCAQKTFP